MNDYEKGFHGEYMMNSSGSQAYEEGAAARRMADLRQQWQTEDAERLQSTMDANNAASYGRGYVGGGGGVQVGIPFFKIIKWLVVIWGLSTVFGIVLSLFVQNAHTRPIVQIPVDKHLLPADIRPIDLHKPFVYKGYSLSFLRTPNSKWVYLTIRNPQGQEIWHQAAGWDHLATSMTPPIADIAKHYDKDYGDIQIFLGPQGPKKDETYNWFIHIRDGKVVWASDYNNP